VNARRTPSRGRSSRALAAVCLLAACAIHAAPARACGYHGSGVGSLNLVYPKALWVRTAVWEARQAGLLPPPADDPVSPEVAAARAQGLVSVADTALQRAAGYLHALERSLAAGSPAQAAPSLSVLLIGPVLWSRIVPGTENSGLQFHVASPRSGDVVMVTDEPVVAALVDGTLAPRAALDRGLVRFYGEDAMVRAAVAAFEALAPSAQPSASARSFAGATTINER
jgi:hypothetical protein